MKLLQGEHVAINLTTMELHQHHDAMQSDDVHLRITRVPGGWIYTFTDIDKAGTRNSDLMNSVFVPYRTLEGI